MPDRDNFLSELHNSVILHQRGFSALLAQCLERADGEGNELAVETLRMMQGQPMHPAYCTGWLRPGMETQMHYCLWLGYNNFDQGLPDQWFGRDANRAPQLAWLRLAI